MKAEPRYISIFIKVYQAVRTYREIMKAYVFTDNSSPGKKKVEAPNIA